MRNDGMKASELIQRLNELVNEHGDLNVCFDTESIGPWEIKSVEMVKESARTYATGRTYPCFRCFVMWNKE